MSDMASVFQYREIRRRIKEARDHLQELIDLRNTIYNRLDNEDRSKIFEKDKDGKETR